MFYDKPLYVALDISKPQMYSFYYDFIKSKYGEYAELCYTDTDCLILEIYTENIYNDIINNLEQFDTSNYQNNNIHAIPKTVSIVGKREDEYQGQVIHSFYGTGAKAYCVILDEEETKKAKAYCRKQTCVDDYKYVVENNKSIYRKIYVF